MKKLNKSLISAFSILTLLNIENVLAAQTNHSYRNMGFTQAPVVTIGGFSEFAGSKVSQESIFEKANLPDAAQATSYDGTKNRNTSGTQFANDTEVHVKVNGISDLGLKYGAIIELEANSTYDSDNQDLNADKAYIFTESYFGKAEFGNNIGASQKMKIGAESIARGAGGINGEYLNYINLPMLAHTDYYAQSGTDAFVLNGGSVSEVKLPRFILIPQHPTGHGGFAKGYNNLMFECDQNGNGIIGDGTIDGLVSVGIGTVSDEEVCYMARDGVDYRLNLDTTEDATKISYYSPKVLGFQVGISYTPDTGDTGTSSYNTGSVNNNIEEILDWGMTYINSINNIGLALSVTGQQGKYEEYRPGYSSREDLTSIEYGASLTYFGLTVAGSIGNWGDSLYEKSVNQTGTSDTVNMYSRDYAQAQALLESRATDYDDLTNYQKFDDAKYYTLGLAYEFGPFSISGTSFSSEFQENEFSAFSVGADYKLAKGLMPYVEVTTFKFESNQPVGTEITAASVTENVIKDNEGHVILMGILLNF